MVWIHKNIRLGDGNIWIKRRIRGWTRLPILTFFKSYIPSLRSLRNRVKKNLSERFVIKLITEMKWVCFISFYVSLLCLLPSVCIDEIPCWTRISSLHLMNTSICCSLAKYVFDYHFCSLAKYAFDHCKHCKMHFGFWTYYQLNMNIMLF